jgi:MFS family permease
MMVMLNILTKLRGLDQRVKVAIISCGILTFASVLVSRYEPLYAASLGADPIIIGLLNSIGSLSTAISGVFIGWVAERYNVKKAILLMIGLFIIHQTIYSMAWSWWLLVLATLISGRVIRMGPFADIIMVTATEPSRRSFVISLSRVVWNFLSVFAPMLAAVIVVYFGGINVQGIRPLYLLQLTLTILVFIYVFIRLPPTLGRVDRAGISSSKHTSVIQSYREAFKGEKYLKRWVLLRIIQTFGQNIAMPFYSLWLVEVKQADPYILGAIGTASLLVILIFQIPMGWLADRIGRKKVFLLFQPFSYLGLFLAIASTTPEHLILAALLGASVTGGGFSGGGVSGLSFPAFITLWWETIPEERRGRFFGIEGLFSLIAIPASILGGLIWQEGFKTEILLIPVILEILIVLPIFITIPEKPTKTKQ